MGATKYNGAYKGEVIASLKQAMSGLKSCKSVSIDIPSDFEAAGTLRNALDTLKGIDIKGAVSEIKSASADFERAESAVEASILDFSNLFGSYIGANTSSKANNYSLKNTQKSGTMYELDHLTNKQKEKINQGVKEASKENGAFRTIASIVNGLVSIFKGGYKMGENIGDFIALRTERLQENHLRTIYTSNAEYEKAYREQYEKNIEKMRKKTMSYVAKDHTEAKFNKLYEENDTLKEIDEKAYSPFKTTGVAYKIGEQVAPAIVATGAMVVAPEAAPTIVPIIIGMNSGGRASEEYLHDKKMNSKEGIEQAYKDGQITKEEYDSYKYIWNLSAEEFSIAMNGMKNQTDKDRLFQTYYMSDKWTKEGNRDEAITYGNAVGAWDAAQYALGMNLFKFNPTNSELLNSSMRVGVDTGLNASDTPFKASVRSLIDQDTDFDTEFEKLGGWNAVGTSAALGFAGSVFGEVVQHINANNVANKIYEIQEISPRDVYDEIKTDLRNDIMGGKISIDDANENQFLLNYAKSKGYSSKRIENWIIDHYDEIGQYGVDQGIYNNHMWYEDVNGNKYYRNSKKLSEVYRKGQGKNLQVKYDDFYINRINDLANRYGLDYQNALQILNIMDTPGGMCSFSASSEAMAYQYANIPESFEKQFGFPLYRETGGIGEQLYVDYFINSNSYNPDIDFVEQSIVKKYNYKGEEVIVGVEPLEQFTDVAGVSSLKNGYSVYGSLTNENDENTASYHTLKKYLAQKKVTDDFSIKNVFMLEGKGAHQVGTIENVIDSIDNGNSVNLSIRPYLNTKTKERYSISFKGLYNNIYNTCNGSHAVNVLGVKGNNVIISTWGNIYSVNLKELEKKAWVCFSSLSKQ